MRFTERNIYVQSVDDVEGKTLASASTRHKEQADRDASANTANSKSAKQPPRPLRAPVSPRRRIGGSRYIKGGKVDALASAARAEGLKF